MNCQEIKNATDIASTNLSFQAHLADCASCRQHVAEMNSLRALLRQQPRLEVPGDFDFHLRARIARAESERQMAGTSLLSLSGRDLWRAVAEWVGNGPLSLALDLRGGVAAAAAVATLVAGLSFYRSFEESAPPLATSDITRLSQSENGDLPSSKVLPSDSVVGEETTATVAPARAIRNPQGRAALSASPSPARISSTSFAAETVALETSASSSDLPTESAWRVYNAERREMISSAQQTTYLGAESSPRLMRGGTKEVGFVPSI